MSQESRSETCESRESRSEILNEERYTYVEAYFWVKIIHVHGIMKYKGTEILGAVIYDEELAFKQLIWNFAGMALVCNVRHIYTSQYFQSLTPLATQYNLHRYCCLTSFAALHVVSLARGNMV